MLTKIYGLGYGPQVVLVLKYGLGYGPFPNPYSSPFLELPADKVKVGELCVAEFEEALYRGVIVSITHDSAKVIFFFILRLLRGKSRT